MSTVPETEAVTSESETTAKREMAAVKVESETVQGSDMETAVIVPRKAAVERTDVDEARIRG